MVRRSMAPGVLLDGSDRLIDEYIAAVHGAAAVAAEKDHMIAELGALLAQREAEAVQRDTELVELNVEIVGARAYAVEISRQYELSVAKEKALGDELLRVTRESEERAVYLLALEEHLATLKLPDDRSV